MSPSMIILGFLFILVESSRECQAIVRIFNDRETTKIQQQLQNIIILANKYMNLNSKKKQEAIRSYLRIKPVQQNQQKYIELKDNQTLLVKGQDQYSFNKIFTENQTNADLFETIGDPLIQHSLQGFNACVLAYGQTSSGKTYTMKGSPSNQGLIPLTLLSLFSNIHQKNMTAQIKISYFQIYNENIIDLLGNPDSNLDIREDYRKNVTIVGLNQIKVNSVEEAMGYFEEGESKRKFSSNTLNLNSSRSHTIFRISLDVVYEDFSRSQSFIHMVDLAGSEGVSKTKAEGSTRKEGDNINKSILALSNVIRHMSEKLSYVNFRDSKLTRILQTSLCSNSRSIVICTINPIPGNLQETLNTLKFGVEASHIKLSLKQNLNLSATSKGNDCCQAGEIYIENNELMANERIQYQENKRALNHLREENQELRDLKRKLEDKIEFLQLQIHRQDGMIKNYEEELQRHRKLVFRRDMNVEERDIFQRKIQDLKSEMNVMADKYEALNEYSSKIQKNQRYLLDRIAKYEHQLEQLKDVTDVPHKPMTPKKPHMKIVPQRQQEYCPLTIGSIVVLRAQIIRLRQQLCQCQEQIARLIEERNEFSQKLQQIDQKRYEHLDTLTSSGKINPSHQEQKEIKSLLIKIKRQKKQINFCKNREKKLINLLKMQAKKTIKEYDQFNDWLQSKNHVENEDEENFN